MKSLICIFLLLFSMQIAAKAPDEKGYDARLSTYDYPFPLKTFAFESQGQKLEMNYMDLNPSGKNNIVLLHGKNFGGFYFKRLAQDLAKKGFRVIIPDQVGFGKSSKPRQYQYSFAQLSHSTQALLSSLGITRYTLLGHSMGGMLATRMALTYPSSLDQLILVNPIGLEDYRLFSSYKTIDENYQKELKTTEESIKTYQSQAYYEGKWKSDYDWLIVPAVGWTKGPDKDLVAYTAALTSDMVFNQPVVHEFSELKVPTSLIIGQRDKTAIGKADASPQAQKLMGNYPKLGKDTARKITKAKTRLIEMEGIGHVPFIENYEAFSQKFFPLLQ